MLERGGYTVQLVDHAAAALSVLGSKQPIDLVFSDVIMFGGINGIALAPEIGKCRPGLPVLLASGYAEAVNDAEAKGLTILRKPYRPRDLVDAIERTLNRTRCADPAQPATLGAFIKNLAARRQPGRDGSARIGCAPPSCP
jgi:DNA-binding NtrC family response regulator